ncbi:MAG: Calx-beta domain-containing protein, partial [Bacteroidota bacterium]
MAETTVSYSTSDNGATGGMLPFGPGVDYESIGTTATSIGAGANPPQVSFNLNINEDSDQESDEGIDIILSALPSGVNALNAPQTFTIRDDDNARKIFFARADTTVQESVGSVNIPVNMTASQVDPTNPTTVEYSILGGTATNVDDYSVLGGGVVTIPSNNISATFPVSIVDDAVNEGVETIIITLSNPTNSNLSLAEPTQFTVNISDNDQQPTIQFNAASSSDLESNTAPSIVITLSAVSGVDAEVGYTVSGSATGGGDDFTLVNGKATITAGSISATINPVVVADGNPEEDETIIITLSSPNNALLGIETVHTYSIVNDDGPFGFDGPGGVGGGAVLPLWLKADSIDGLADGAQIEQWSDVSGSGNDANQATSTYRATWENAPVDQINGFPVVRFDGVDDHYDDTGYSYNVKTAFIVFKVSSSAQSASELGHIWGSYNELVQIAAEPRGGADQFGFSFDGNQSGFGTARYSLDGEDYGGLVDDANYYPWSYDAVHMVAVEYDDLESLTRQILGGIVDNFSIGAQQYGGDVAEIIVFSQELSEVRRSIVENYLAAKYGISLPVAKDLYAFESTHFYDVAGLGQDLNGDAHQAAQSNNILRVSNASSLDNDDYLLFGHDNASLTWSGAEAPTDSVQRIGREWVMDETGDLGTVTIAIDTTHLPTKPTDHEGYVLLIDDNGNFSAADGGTTIIPLTKSGKYYLANGVDFSDGDYLSIGTVGITLQLAISAANAGESNGAYDIVVALSRPSTGDTDLTFAADVASTADEGAILDFSISSPLQILTGSTIGNITVTINDDADVELDETVIVNLLSVDNGVSIGAKDQFTLTIQDNDASSTGTTGPGGVRRASSYEAWWSADSAVFSDLGSTPAVDAGGVQQWNDLSGSTEAHPATVFAVTTDPSYNLTTNLVNGKPAIDFSAGDSPLTVLNETGLNATDHSFRTFAVAFETGTDLTTRQVIYEEGGGTNGFNVWIQANTVHVSIWDGTWDV